ncbi:hypothetical protein M8C21_009572 [Ambrosia artemisiifolia]|uniref:Uncharacterized protein n=1 Tax=Ambrosia artemisiifolia TaxID=4212 RepID=A0AAD5D6S5_AMBAR|nr:hypothetical protein M8C21_009572 [Ambrosia artemisiifolia]
MSTSCFERLSSVTGNLPSFSMRNNNFGKLDMCCIGHPELDIQASKAGTPFPV